MKQLTFAMLLAFVMTNAGAQSNPVSVHADVPDPQFVMDVDTFCVRLDLDPATGILHYMQTNGNIYRVLDLQGTPYDSLVYDASMYPETGISFAFGMAFYDSTLYVAANRYAGANIIGYIFRGVLQPNGSRLWSTVAETAPYGASYTSFDHGLTGIAFSNNGDTLYVSSGSRTNHGELQSGLREEDITSAILRIPADAQHVMIPNDIVQLAANGYLYCDGTRNSFSLLNVPGVGIIGTENSDEADHPEELNWLRPNRHYGFPWVMGGYWNPQQFPGFDPSNHPLINTNNPAYQQGYYYNDPTFPPAPVGVNFESAIRNFGPDADNYRDTINLMANGQGQVLDASDLSTSIASMTPHSSPLGLIHDRDSVLEAAFQGDLFLVRWTPGYDSTGGSIPWSTGPFVDQSQDLLQVELTYNASQDNYDAQMTSIVQGFDHPIDACLVGDQLYVIEFEASWSWTNASLWVIDMPEDTTGGTNATPVYGHDFRMKVSPNPAADVVNFTFNMPHHGTSVLEIYGMDGRAVKQKTYQRSKGLAQIRIPVHELASGSYLYVLRVGEQAHPGKFVVNR